LRDADTLRERNRKIGFRGGKEQARFILDNRTQIAAELAGLWIKGRDRGDATLQIRQKFLQEKPTRWQNKNESCREKNFVRMNTVMSLYVQSLYTVWREEDKYSFFLSFFLIV
jgi:hypothetical protein